MNSIPNISYPTNIPKAPELDVAELEMTSENPINSMNTEQFMEEIKKRLNSDDSLIFLFDEEEKNKPFPELKV